MRIEEKVMRGIADFVIKRYKLIPFIAVALFILSIIAAFNIDMKTEMKDMLPDDNPQIQSYIEIYDEFQGGSLILITVEGNDKKQMIDCAEDFVKETRSREDIMKYVKAINLKTERDFAINWGLMLQKAKDIKQTKKMFSKLNLLPFLDSLNNSFEETYTGDEAEEDIETSKQENEATVMLNQMETFFVLLRQYLEDPKTVPVKEQGKILADTFLYGNLYNFCPDNSMLMFSISPNFDYMQIEKMNDMMKSIRQVVAKMQKQYPGLFVSYSGDMAVGADEMTAMSFDMAVPALVALVLMVILFAFSFTQLRAIAFSLIALIFGIVYTYGLIGITSKEINLMTSAMAVLLLGLGIDYGIQVLTNFTTYRRDGYPAEEAMRNTYIKSGMGTFLAALTTAIGFFVLALTGSKTFSQFGFVMGMGIVSCYAAMTFILPSLLLWFGKKELTSSRIPTLSYNFITKLGLFTNKRKLGTLILSAIITIGLFAMIFRNEFDYDLMNMEPQDMPSIIQYNKIEDKYSMNPFTNMVIAEDLDEARIFTRALEKERLIAEVTSLATMIPTDREQEARLREIAKIRNMPERITARTYTSADIKEFAEQVQRVEYNIIEMGDLSVAGLGEDNKITRKRNEIIREIYGAEVGKPGKEVFQRLIKLVKSDPSLYAARLTRLDKYFAGEMNRIVSNMTKINRKITIADLPKDAVNAMLHEDGKRNLVTAYPRKGLLKDIKDMERLNKRIHKISPKITGTTLLITEWMDEMLPSSRKAAVYIFITVFIFMLLTFRNLKYSILASIPLLIGMIWMLGIHPLLGLKFNFLNYAFIPMVIGMGIDFGIHLVHRFITENGDIETTYKYTGKAVFLSAATTMIGFSSLALVGSYPAIASIGSILFLGIGACLLTSLIILPALLKKKKD